MAVQTVGSRVRQADADYVLRWVFQSGEIHVARNIWDLAYRSLFGANPPRRIPDYFPITTDGWKSRRNVALPAIVPLAIAMNTTLPVLLDQCIQIEHFGDNGDWVESHKDVSVNGRGVGVMTYVGLVPESPEPKFETDV